MIMSDEDDALECDNHVFIKGVTVYMQIRRCVMKFCQVDKISTGTCIFGDTEIL